MLIDTSKMVSMETILELAKFTNKNGIIGKNWDFVRLKSIELITNC